MDTTADRIRAFISRHFKNKKEFAEQIGISQQHLSAYLTGKRVPALDLLSRFHQVGMSIDWLISGEGSDIANSEGGEKLRRESVSNRSNISEVHDSRTVKVPFIRDAEDLKRLMKEAMTEVIHDK